MPAPAQEEEFAVLADPRAEGVTDDLVMPAPISRGSVKAETFAADRPTVLDDDVLALIAALSGAC